MDMFEGVGRRLDQTTGTLVNIGAHSLNGRERKVLFRNNGDGTFTDVAFVDGADRQEDGRGLSIFDYDNDGRLDLLLRNYKQPTQLLRNVGSRGHWVDFKLVGTVSNRDAIGAKIRLRTDAGWQTRVVSAGSAYLSNQSLIQHFGLGADDRVRELSIWWPSDATTQITDLPGGHRFTITENSLSPISCADPACPD
jgi:ASPIC and UnbV/FG-GAP-like repeat